MDGSGVLFLVVGASGVGKDSLIDGARQVLEGDRGYDFPIRTITRPADAGGEVHHAVAEQAFDRLEADGAFMLSWRAHGHRYGVPIEAEQALASGGSVVVNVSRQVIEEARRRWSPVRVMLITAPRTVLSARLEGRGRETREEIARRLDQTDAYRIEGDDVRELVNDAGLDLAISSFVALLEAERHAAMTAGKENDRSE